jgi:hypothetical protein
MLDSTICCSFRHAPWIDPKKEVMSQMVTRDNLTRIGYDIVHWPREKIVPS